MPFLSSLKRAIIFNFILVASVPLLVFGLINIDLVVEHQLAGVRERNVNQAKSVAEETESFLLEVNADLQHVQQTIASGQVLRSEAINSFLSGLVRNSRFFESIYLLDKDYQVLNLGVMPKLQPRQDDFASLDFSGHTLFSMFGDEGAIWSHTFVSVVTGEPSVTRGLLMPEGFLLGNVRLSSLGNLLQRYASYGDIEVAIVDQRGTLVAHSVSEVARQRVNFSNHPVVTKAMKGEVSTKEFIQGTQHYLESAVRIDSSNWVVWVGLDMNKVQEPIQKTRKLLVGVMLVAIVLACLLAVMNVRRLMAPLTALGARAGDIADGKYDFKFRASGFVEIDTLAEQIANMSEAIQVREESIIANEERFRGLVNSIDGIVWEMEYPSFRFVFVSKQSEAILGYPRQDWYEISDFWQRNTHPDDVEQVKSYCRLMSEKRQDHSFEYRMKTADDRTVWIRNLVTVVVERDRPVRLIGVMLDVSSEKALLEELLRSEQNYREIFNATSDAIFIHDSETGEILDVNQAMLDIFHCTYEEALNGGLGTFSKGVPPYSMEEAVEKVVLAKVNGHCEFEWQARKATGEVFWVDVSLRSTTIGGKPRVVAAVRDVSSRKLAEDSLREVNARLRLLIDRMPLGCIFWTPDFTVDIWNPAAESIFGFNIEEMKRTGPFTTILSTEIEPDVKQVWARLMSGDKTAHSVNENLTKDRGAITCEWYNTPVLGFQDEVIGVISMVQDVTDRKAVEQELANYRSHLEELVKQRTRALEKTQEQLVQQERLAVLGQLTTTVSHEIRNPLGTVANSLYLLKEALKGESKPQLERPLQLAERNVERCDGIISDLLDFSRQRKIEKESLDIDAWIEALLNELSLSDEINCTLDLNATTTVPIDTERMRRALVNVITNAVEAMGASANEGKTLEIKTFTESGFCKIIVIDNGEGMSNEVLAKIYEPMFSTKNFGVGLGVSIIKSILEGHKGSVDYQSEVGKGTTVTMTLPLEASSSKD